MAESVRINLPSELFAPAESSFFEGTIEIPALKAGPDLYSFTKPLSWKVDITNTGDALLVMGTVEGEAVTSCARCLEDVHLDFMGEIEGYFLLSEGTAPEDLDDDEFDVLPPDHILDLEPLIKAALLLEFPYIPLCKDDCKGLCPQCGANLNEGPCGCQKEEEEENFAKNPFAVLKDYRFDEEALNNS